MHTTFYLQYLKEGINLGYVVGDGREILKWILKLMWCEDLG